MTVISFDGTNKLNGLFYMWKQNNENFDELVNVAAVSNDGSHYPSNILDQTSSTWRCIDTNPHWISFHLLKHRFSLSQYSLWQFSGFDNIKMKSWLLEGSNDGSSWTQIDQQNEPTDICVSNSKHSFVTSSGYFSFFRLTKIGTSCSSGTDTRFYSLEFFGTLIENNLTFSESKRCICQTSIPNLFIFYFHPLIFQLILSNV